MSVNEWQPIESAPEMKTVLLYAVTDEAPNGEIRNWKMGTGFYHTGWEADDGSSPWNWEGNHIPIWEYLPTHWQSLPPPPSEGTGQ